MDSAISSRKTTLHTMLGRNASAQVRVPDYQRGYSWERKHFSTFFEDICGFSESQDRRPTDVYFLGPLVVMRGHATDDYFYLVDGQHRLHLPDRASLMRGLESCRGESEKLLSAALGLLRRFTASTSCPRDPTITAFITSH